LQRLWSNNQSDGMTLSREKSTFQDIHSKMVDLKQQYRQYASIFGVAKDYSDLYILQGARYSILAILFIWMFFIGIINKTTYIIFQFFPYRHLYSSIFLLHTQSIK
jgi:hypothetical protein